MAILRQLTAFADTTALALPLATHAIATIDLTYYLSPTAMGKRRRHATQTAMWVATNDLPRSAAHPFYTRLNQVFERHDFDGFVEGVCQRLYADGGRLHAGRRASNTSRRPAMRE